MQVGSRLNPLYVTHNMQETQSALAYMAAIRSSAEGCYAECYS